MFRRTVAAQNQRLGVLAVFGWSTADMLDRYTRWMQEEESEAIRPLQGARALWLRRS